MTARLFGTIALVLLPTFAFAIDAGKTGSTNETTPTNQTEKMKPDNAKAAETAPKNAPISPDKATAAGAGGDAGATTTEPKKTP
jgi:hypothetical protein